jgi:AbiV family abortive infection protein
MRVRASRDLSQLPDTAFFAEVAEGLDLILKNAQRLQRGAQALGEAKQYGSRVLQALAEEEVAKFFILLDAVRCPRLPPQRFAAQLARFSDHLAKGLYARAYDMRPATLGQLQHYLDGPRKEFYLDGPNDVDWIFRNDVLQRREELFYVDYIVTDDGHLWMDPARYDYSVSDLPHIVTESHPIHVAGTLFNAGVSTPESLAVVAKIWRPISMLRETRWSDLRALNTQTLKQLASGGMLRPQPDSVYQTIINEWQFPLYDLDLTLIEVDKNELRQRQESWTLDW